MANLSHKHKINLSSKCFFGYLALYIFLFIELSTKSLCLECNFGYKVILIQHCIAYRELHQPGTIDLDQKMVVSNLGFFFLRDSILLSILDLRYVLLKYSDFY